MKWKLFKDEVLMGYLTDLNDGEMFQIRCQFDATLAFSEIEPLFVRENELIDDDGPELEAASQAIYNLKLVLRTMNDAHTLTDLLLGISGNIATFRPLFIEEVLEAERVSDLSEEELKSYVQPLTVHNWE